MTDTSGLFLRYTIQNTEVNVYTQGLYSFKYTSSIDSQAEETKLIVYDTAYDLIESIIDVEGSEVEFQYGWQEGNISNKKLGIITAHSPVFESDASLLTIVTHDKSILLSRGNRNKSYFTRASSVVRTIALEHALPFDIETTNQDFLFINPWYSDIEFIKCIVRPKSVSKLTNRADYDLYISEGRKLHFHPPRYDSEVRGTYILGQSKGVHPAGTVLKFLGLGNTEKSNFYGGISYNVQGYDYRRKQVIDFTSSDESIPERIVIAKPIKKDALKLPKVYEVNRYFDSASDSTRLVEAESRTRYFHADRTRYGAYVLMVGDPKLLAGDLVNILQPKTGDRAGLHAMSGFYLIHTIVHNMVREQGNVSYYTELFLIRPGTLSGADSLSGKAKSVNSNPIIETSFVKKSSVGL